MAQGVTQSVFSVPFEFFEDSDVNVYVDGVQKTEGSDYTLTGGEGSTGTLTFSSGVTGASGGSTVVLFRRIAIERTTDFQVGQDINRTALNEQLDTLTALVADMNDRWDRSVHIEDFDTGQVNFVLPPKAQRVNAYFAFDADGDPVMTSGTTSDIIVSTFAETLLDDDTAVDMLATLGVTASPAELNLLDGVTALTGADGVLVTGTSGTDGQIAQWNADGDVVGVDKTLPEAAWEAGTSTTESLVSPAKVKAAIDVLAPPQSPRLISTTTLTGNEATVTITGLGGYRHIMVWTDADTNASFNVFRELRVGTSSGILSTSIYVQSGGPEQTSILLNSNAGSTSLSGSVTIYNFNTTDAVKPVINTSTYDTRHTTAIDSALAFDRVQLFPTSGASFLSGSRFLVWGWN